MRKIVLAFVSVIFTMSAYCQSAEWLVSPDKYSNIEYFAPSLYKVSANNAIGIIDAYGKTILEAKYDVIENFHEGRSLVLNRTSNGFVIKAVLAEDGTIEYASDVYYLLPEYNFYSEGLLPVRDTQGKYGYLDEKLQPAFAFITEEIRPFSEGLASVGEGETFHWITTDGTQILPRLSNGGTPYTGTNFYDGRAYLWDEDGVEFTLDSDGNIKKSDVPNANVVDYLYCSGTNRGLSIPYSQYSQDEPNAFWTPEESDGKWSYKSKNGKLLMPFMYDNVQPFYDGVAIASLDGKYGLLRIVEDESTFSTSAPNKNYIFSSGTACNCEFQLSVPEKWRNRDITVVMKDPETGRSISIKKDSKDGYSFSYQPDASNMSEVKNFNVEVSDNGIQLWQGDQKFRFVQRVKLSSRIAVNNSIANVRDQCSVTAVIKNPSPVAVTTTVTLSGGGNSSQFNKKTVTLTIPAYSSKSINSSFLVKKVELNGWCAVATTDGTSAKKSNLQLSPNF